MSTNLSDKELVRLSGEPVGELFPLLHRSHALVPLVVVLAFVPGVIALTNASFDTATSLWALRGLDCYVADSFNSWLEPGRGADESPLKYHPPLASWLVAGSFHLFGPHFTYAPFVPSYVMSAFSVLLMYRLVKRLMHTSGALMAAVLTCCHGQVLSSIQSPGPEMTELCLILATVNCFLSYAESPRRLWRWSLVGCGLSLGLLVMAGGPVALAMGAVLVLYSLLFRPRQRGGPLATSYNRQVSRMMLKALVLITLLAVLVGGWWFGLMFTRHGKEFVVTWLAGDWVGGQRFCTLLMSAADDTQVVRSLQDWMIWHGTVIGWQILGFVRTIKNWLAPETESDGRNARLLLVWFLVGAGLWLAALGNPVLYGRPSLRWQIFLVAPGILFATIGLNEVIERRVALRYVAIAMGISLAWMIAAGVLLVPQRVSPLTAVALMLYFGSVFGFAGWQYLRTWKERHRRRLLQVVTLGMLCGHVIWSEVTLKVPGADAQRMAHLRSKLASAEQVAGVTLVAPEAIAPPQVKFMLRSLWPHAPFTVSNGWPQGQVGPIPRGQELINQPYLFLDWSRRDLAIPPAPAGGWQVKRLSEPIRFLGRKLSANLLIPQGVHISLGWLEE
jgi:4-amino-4-deoxy-L-arabinose transferase-like glycosyltransferase